MTKPTDLAPTPAGDRLRIAILLDSFEQPRWVYRTLEHLQASGLGKVVLVVRTPPTENHRGVWWRIAHLGYLVHTTLDDWYFGRESDALAPTSLEPLLEGVDVVEAERLSTNSGALGEIDLREVENHRLDVALAFGPPPRGAGVQRIARYGLWVYRAEPAAPPCLGSPGFWEVLQGRPVTESVLERRTAQGRRVLWRSFSATDPFSARRNRDHACSKAATFVARALRDLRDPDGRPLESGSEVGPEGSAVGAARCPGNLEMLYWDLRLAARFARDRWSRLRFTEQWSLALSLDAPPLSPGRPTLIHPPRDRSWADPFPILRGNDCFIFIEEIPRHTRRGHISVLVTDRRGAWQPPIKILERDHHLAYPFVFEWQGEVFMIPESRANRTVELFRCTRFPETWKLEKVLMRDLSGSDATLHEIDGRFWMFVNIAAPGAKNTWDELHLYHADTPLGPWTPHRRNPVKSDVRSSRPAGRLFLGPDGLYRPAQDCSRRYGHAIVLHRVSRLDPEHFDETEVSRILPDWDPSLLATHTYNRVDGLTVMDALVRRPRIV